MVQYLNRMVYQQATGATMREIGAQDLDAVEISGTRSMRYGFRSHRNYAYPDHDICGAPFIDPDGTPVRADIILAEQVWEHLDRPYRANRNTYERLNPGRYLGRAAPFLCRIPGVPAAWSRWPMMAQKAGPEQKQFDVERLAAMT